VKRCDRHVKECQHVCEDTPTGIKCSCFDGFRAEGSSCTGNPNAGAQPQRSHTRPFAVSYLAFLYFSRREKLTSSLSLSLSLSLSFPLSFFFRNLIFPSKFPQRNARVFFVRNTYSDHCLWYSRCSRCFSDPPISRLSYVNLF